MTGNLKDQSVLITGGTDGIGRALLVELVQEGAAVTVVGRSLSKWEETRKLLPPESNVDFLKYDLSLMQNVKALGETVLNRTRNVSVVVHCAGVMLRDKTLTDEGLEEVFAVQFLARYYLNKLLLPHLEATKGKVVVVSAGGSIRGIKFDFDNLQGEKFYNGVHALKHESLANDMQILEYSKRYPYILWFNYGPGVVKTTLLRDMGPLLQTIASLVSPCMSISPERAAEDIVELLTSQKESGLYGRGIKLNRPNAFRSDSVNQARLREVSDGLIEKALEHLQRKK